MKGLIYKDIIALKQVALSIILIMMFYIFLGFMSQDEANQASYFAVMAMMMNMMVPLTCAGYDDQCGWDSFGGALPIGRAGTVVARYCTNLIVMMVSLMLILISDLISMAFGHSSMGAAAYVIPVAGAALYVSLFNPIIYKFGTQKSRFLAFIPALTIAALGAVISRIATSEDGGEEALEKLDAMIGFIGQHILAVTVCTIAACATLFVLSMLLSISIYRNKDF